MSGVNKAIILGNLGGDPEVRFMPNGNAVANITIATSENWKDKQTGEQKSKVEWHRVVLFGKLAEIAGEYLKKGSKVYIEGALQTRKWTNQQGQDQYTTEIVVQGYSGVMQMLSPLQQQGQQNQGGQQQQNHHQGNNNQQSNNGYQQSQGNHQQQGGFNNQAPIQQRSGQQQSQNNREPSIDFDDDIPFR